MTKTIQKALQHVLAYALEEAEIWLEAIPKGDYEDNELKNAEKLLHDIHFVNRWLEEI